MMLKLLIKKQLAEIFRSYFYDAKKNKKRSKGATVLFFVFFVLLMVGLLGGLFTALSLSICDNLVPLGLDWMYFALIGLIAVLLGTFGSVFNTYAGLYLAKDNDLLLSLPIPVRSIILSRLLSVYLMGLLYSGVVTIPAAIVYLIKAPFSAGVPVGGLLFVVLTSAVVLILSCVLGWVVAKVSLKLKNKSFITVLLSLVFFGAYYFVCFRWQTALQSFLQNAAQIGVSLQKIYPLYVIGLSGTGSWGAMAAVTAVVLALLTLTWRLLSGSFLRIATSSGSAAARPARTARETVQRSVYGAVRAKEFRRFFASPAYMLNCGFGAILLPIVGVLALVRGSALMQMLAQMGGVPAELLTVLIPAVVALLAAMCPIAAPSVSLEGKSLWLLRSLPVTPWQVLRAKLAVHLTVTLPAALLCAGCLLLVVRPTLLLAALSLLLTALLCLLLALAALCLGLLMPNLTWTSEIAPIKQGGAVAISLLGGWVFAAAVGVSGALLAPRLGAGGCLLLLSGVAVVLSRVLAAWLSKRGAKRFAEL